ncbi:FecR domain-containing protein [Mucilaginibacter sp. Bleaf8]|uniref:FecR family protein n=1 Tax=Mucilaginibacter sp. Bleaf8 TaxID=2834430 RepID=UPI001BCC8727|nr:FecR family protein [Mucilaginibacter sp. Bleaf8]MBS7563880.1 FecR domain-containing protein [Mucilaginibacter sp. Bleaf8]
MNAKESAHIKELLQRYQTGTATPEERERVERWYAQINQAEPQLIPYADEERLIKNTRQQVLKQTNVKVASLHIMRHNYFKVAAVLLLIPFAYVLYSQLKKTQTPTSQQFTTERGERKIITLPDSTEVVLNASSSLVVNNDFGTKLRRVSLSGEGYFRVKHDASRPFIIQTGRLQTRVLGTEFDVHAYKNESKIKVAVVNGRVKVSEERQHKLQQLGEVLTHNLLLVYNTKTQRHAIRTADAEKLSAWQNGELYFEDASIGEITATLSRHYNTSIKLNGQSKANCRYTIGFSRQSLNKVLAVLSQLTGMHYQIQPNQVIIQTDQCH